MPSLLDIAPLVETVTVRGVDLHVRGLGIDSIAYLIQRYPQLGAAIAERAIDAATLVQQAGPAIVGTIVACAVGMRGNAEHEAAAAGLALGEQVDVIEAVLRMTAPGGVVPFVERITKMLGVAGPAVVIPAQAPDTTSPSPPSD